ncbi:MAG TPA: hypothetical protein VK879_02690 [Candidatus Sulfomarinibacteraceae bacterium]|nr:hypothetical protein [Candidatus Sulfomarinibacteraceae bacterium]
MMIYRYPQILLILLLAPAPDAVSPAATDAGVSSVLPAALLLAGLTLITLAVWLYWRQGADPQPVTATHSAGSPAGFDALVTEIALLDEAHEAGRINETDYTRRRSLLFAQAQQGMPEGDKHVL